MHSCQIAPQDDAARERESRSRSFMLSASVVAIGHKIPNTRSIVKPFRVKAGDSQHIGQIHLANKCLSVRHQFD